MRKLKVALLLVVMMIASLCLSFACFGAIEIVDQDDTHEYTAITVTGNPTKTEYGVGETLSTEGLVISAHCSKHNTDEAISLSDVKITYEHGGSFAYGDTKVTITYAGYTAEIRVTVVCKNHVAGTPVRENEVAATCSAEGSYEEVVYCTVCGAEVSRETKTIEKIAHTPAEAVRENEVAATCTKEGSYDEVVYCSVCNEELSRETKTTEKIAHTPAEAVKENEVAATCTKEGSYDEVVYCSVCNTELSRETKTTPVIAHTEGEVKYDENNHWVECSVCKEAIPGTVTAHTLALEVTGSYKTSYTLGETFDSENAIVKTVCDCGYNKVADYEVIYENGDSFDIGDTKVTIKVGDLAKDITVTVSANVGEFTGDFSVNATYYCGETPAPVSTLTVNSGADIYFMVSEDGVNYVKLEDYVFDAPEDEISITLYIIAVADATEEYTAVRTEAKTFKLRHFIPSELSFDENGHYYLCACGVKFDEQKHSLTLEKDTDLHKHYYTCACGYETEKVDCASTGEYVNDAANHWKTCDVCGQEIEKAAHAFDYESDEEGHWQVCACGYETEKASHVEGETKFDADNHWVECSVCGEKIESTVEKHDLTVTFDEENKTHSFSCDCGYAREDEACSSTGEWKHDAANHWKLCDVCGQEIEKAAHVPGDAEVDGDYSVVKCSVCGEAIESVPVEARTNVDLKWNADGSTDWAEGKIPVSFAAFGNNITVTEFLLDNEEIGFDLENKSFNFDNVKLLTGLNVFTAKITTASGAEHEVIYYVDFVTKGIYNYTDLVAIKEVSKAYGVAQGNDPVDGNYVQDGYYKLFDNITADGTEWTGICETQGSVFSGVIDGNGYAIDGIRLTHGEWRMSFIDGSLTGGEIKNVAFTNAVLRGNGAFLMMGGGRINNVYIQFAELVGATNTQTHVISRSAGYVATNVVIDLSKLNAGTLTTTDSIVLTAAIYNTGAHLKGVYIIDPNGLAKKNNLSVFSVTAKLTEGASNETLYYTANGDIRRKSGRVGNLDVYEIVGKLTEVGYFNDKDIYVDSLGGDVFTVGDYSELIGVDTANWDETIWTVAENSVPYYAPAVAEVIDTENHVEFTNIADGDYIAQGTDFTFALNKSNVKLTLNGDEEVLSKVTLNGNTIRIEDAEFNAEFRVIATYAFDYEETAEITVKVGKSTVIYDLGEYDLEINLHATLVNDKLTNNNTSDYNVDFTGTAIATAIEWQEINKAEAVYVDGVLVDAAPSFDVDTCVLTFNAANIPATSYGETELTVVFSGEYSMYNATYQIGIVTTSISTEQQFKEMVFFVNAFEDNGGYYVLDSDIKLNGAISNYGMDNFAGVLDGRGHVVDGLWVTGTSSTDGGRYIPGSYIINFAADAVIRNIAFVNMRTAGAARFICNVFGTLDNVYIHMDKFTTNTSGNWMPDHIWSGTYIIGSQFGRNATFNAVVVDMSSTAADLATFTKVPAIGHDYYSFFAVNNSDTLNGVMVLGVTENWKSNTIRIVDNNDYNHGGDGANANVYVEYVDGTTNGVELSFNGYDGEYWYLINGLAPVFKGAFDSETAIEFTNAVDNMELPVGGEFAVTTNRADVELTVEGNENVSISDGVITISENAEVGTSFKLVATNKILPEMKTEITIYIIATVVNETLSETTELNFEATIDENKVVGTTANVVIDLNEYGEHLAENVKVLSGSETIADDVAVNNGKISLDASLLDAAKVYGNVELTVASYKDDTNYYITVPMLVITKTVTTAAEFVALKDYAALMENNGGYFVLGNNIELEDPNMRPSQGLNILGALYNGSIKYHNQILKFSGVIDGNGYTVKNLAIASASVESGWIAESDNATIKNIAFVNIVKGLRNAIVYKGAAHFENCYFQFDSVSTLVNPSAANYVYVGYASDGASIANPTKPEATTFDNVVADFTVATEEWKSLTITNNNSKYKGWNAYDAAVANYTEMVDAFRNGWIRAPKSEGNSTNYYKYYTDETKTVEITRDDATTYWFAFNANYFNHGGAIFSFAPNGDGYNGVIILGVPASRISSTLPKASDINENVEYATIFRLNSGYSNGSEFANPAYVEAIDGTTNGVTLDTSSFDTDLWYVVDGFAPIFKSAFDNTPVAITNLTDKQEVFVDSEVELAINRSDVTVEISALNGVTLDGNTITVSENAQVGSSFTVTVTNVIDPENTLTITLYVGYKVVNLESENVTNANFEATISDNKLISNAGNIAIDVSDLSEYLGTTAEVSIGSTVIAANATINNGVITIDGKDLDPAKVYGDVDFTVKTLKGATNYIISAHAKFVTKSINTAEEFVGLKNYVALIENNGGYFKLANDIELTVPNNNLPAADYANANIWGAGYTNGGVTEELLWDNRIPNFSGVIDGDGYIVNNMWLGSLTSSGWIVKSNNATIKNIAFTNLNLTYANYLVVSGAATLENVYADVSTVTMIKRNQSEVVKSYQAASLAHIATGITSNTNTAHTLKNVVVDFTKATQEFIDKGYAATAQSAYELFLKAINNNWVSGSSGSYKYYTDGSKTTTLSYNSAMNFWTGFQDNFKSYGGTMMGNFKDANLLKDIVVLGVPSERLHNAGISAVTSNVFRLNDKSVDGSSFGAYVTDINGDTNGVVLDESNWNNGFWKFINGLPVPASFKIAEHGRIADVSMDLDVYINAQNELAKVNSGSVSVDLGTLANEKNIVALRDAFTVNNANYNIAVENNVASIPYSVINANSFGDVTFYAVSDDGCFYDFTVRIVTKNIKTADEFIALKDYIAKIENGGGLFLLANDITLENANNIYCGGANADNQLCDNRITATFTGTIDGQGHTVDNLRLSSGRDSASAWLTSVDKATLKNINFTNLSRAGKHSLIGSLGGSITVDNVYIQVSSMARLDMPGGAPYYSANYATNLAVLRNGAYGEIQTNDVDSTYSHVVMDFTAATEEIVQRSLTSSAYYSADAGAIAVFVANAKELSNFVVTGVPTARLQTKTIFRTISGATQYNDGSYSSTLFVKDVDGNTNGNDINAIAENFDLSYWKVGDGKILPISVPLVETGKIDAVTANLDAVIDGDNLVAGSTEVIPVTINGVDNVKAVAIRDSLNESNAKINIDLTDKDLAIPVIDIPVDLYGEVTAYVVTEDNNYYEFTLNVITKTITTAEEFVGLKNYVALIENNGGYFKLANDIELTVPNNNLLAADYANANIWGTGYTNGGVTEELLWDNRIPNFSGVIDGDGYAVNNLWLGSLTSSGWIIASNNATIKNIAFTNLNLTNANYLVVSGAATLENVYADVSTVTTIKRNQSEKVTSYQAASLAHIATGITSNTNTAHTLKNVVVDFTKATQEFIDKGFAATAQSAYELYLTAIDNNWITGSSGSYKYYTDDTLTTELTWNNAINYWTGFQDNYKSYGGTMMGNFKDANLLKDIVVLGVPSERLHNAGISAVTSNVFRLNGASVDGSSFGAYVTDINGNTNGTEVVAGNWDSTFWSFEGDNAYPTFNACLNKAATKVSEIDLDATLEDDVLKSSSIATLDLSELGAGLFGDTANVYIGETLVAEDVDFVDGVLTFGTEDFPIATAYGEVEFKVVTVNKLGKINTLTVPALIVTKGIGDYATLDNLYVIAQAMGNAGYYKLTADITNSENADWANPLLGFANVASDADAFKGTIDGDGHTIDGLIFNNGSKIGYQNNYSIIGHKFNGVVKNINFINVDFRFGKAAIIANSGTDGNGTGGLIEDVFVSFKNVAPEGNANIQGTFIRTGGRVYYKNCVVDLTESTFNNKFGFSAIGKAYDLNPRTGAYGTYGIDGVYVVGIKENMALANIWQNSTNEYITYTADGWKNYKVVSGAWTEDTELATGQSLKVQNAANLGAYATYAEFKAAYAADSKFNIENTLFSITSATGVKTNLSTFDKTFWGWLIEKLSATDGDPGTGLNATLVDDITDAQFVSLTNESAVLDLTAVSDYVGETANVVYGGEIVEDAHLITVTDGKVTFNATLLEGAVAGADTIYVVTIANSVAYKIAVPVVFADLIVSTKSELDAIGTAISANANAYIVLSADIDYEDAVWAGINGDFAGTFDGAGHKISNIAFTTESGSFVKGTLTGTIKNVTFDGVTLDMVSIIAHAGENATLDTVTVVYTDITDLDEDDACYDEDGEFSTGGLFHAYADGCTFKNVTVDTGDFMMDEYAASYFGWITTADGEYTSTFENVVVIDRLGAMTSNGRYVYVIFDPENGIDWVDINGTTFNGSEIEFFTGITVQNA